MVCGATGCDHARGAASITASAVADVGMSMISSTFSCSHHLRASVAATSGLVASALTSSIGFPNIWPPKSSIAIFAASIFPLPPMSE